MKRHAHTRVTPVLITLAALGLFASSLLAEEVHHEEHVLLIRAADGALVETDISDLALGESRSLVTESGHMIDLLQTPEGLEIYLDGDLIDRSEGAEALHERLEQARELAEEACGGVCEDGFAYAFSSEDGEDASVRVVHKKVEIICSDDDPCDDSVWISAGEDRDMEVTIDGDEPNIIVIHTEREHSID